LANFQSYYSSTNTTTDASKALESWLGCHAQHADTNKLLVVYTPFGANSVTGRLRLQIRQGQSDHYVTGVTVAPSVTQDKVQCSIGGVSFSAETDAATDSVETNNIPLPANTDLSFQCSKPVDEGMRLSIATTFGDSAFMEVASEDQLENRLAQLKVRLSEESEKRDVAIQRMEVQTNTVDALKAENERLLRRHNAQLFSIYAGAGRSGALRGDPDFHARCGTIVDRNYGETQCKSRDMDYWALNKVGTYLHGDPGGCGQVWYALLCQAR